MIIKATDKDAPYYLVIKDGRPLSGVLEANLETKEYRREVYSHDLEGVVTSHGIEHGTFDSCTKHAPGAGYC